MTYQIPLDSDLIVDNFAGGGGASTGIEGALGRPVNIAINHDPQAVAMHMINHPLTRHYCEDVWEVDPREVTRGRSVLLAWFSPDCKHFSKAKGGALVDKKIRGLAWVVIRWAALVKPRIIMLENVEEFTTWGPVIDGKPCPTRKGQTFNSFVRQLRGFGYQVEWKELRACDYGAPTIRKRLFMVARCDGLPIVWPDPTHGPAGSGLPPYRTAAECIDWSIPCPSIFERDRPLAENTLRRIAKGIQRYVIDAKEPFIIKVNHKYKWFRGQPLNEPLHTITAQNPYALVSPAMIQMGYGEREGQQPRTLDLEKPLGTVTAGGNKFALCAAFLAKHFGGVVGADITEPYPTILARGTQTQLVTSHILKMRGHHSRDKHGQNMNEPLHTISASGTHHAEVRAFLLKYYGNEKEGQGMSKPLGTVTTKDRFGLVTIEGAEYAIVDIGMRMLTPAELYRAQGFPENYIFDRGDFDGEIKPLTKVAQVRMCGNSVSPYPAAALVRANVPRSALYEVAA